jgi:hypothetical protein
MSTRQAAPALNTPREFRVNFMATLRLALGGALLLAASLAAAAFPDKPVRLVARWRGVAERIKLVLD